MNAGTAINAASINSAVDHTWSVSPSAIAGVTMHTKPDHHPVVQFGAAFADGERQPGNCLAVCLSEAADGTLANSLTEHSDNFNFCVAREDVHGGPNPSG